MKMKIYNSQLDDKDEFTIKQFSMVGDSLAVVLSNGEFKFFDNPKCLIEIVEESN